MKVQMIGLWLRSFSQQSINDQEDDGAGGGDENSTEVERLNLPEPDEAAQKTADDRAGDADEDCDYDPAWVLPGHDELCDSPGNEAQKDPGENTHAGEECCADGAAVVIVAGAGPTLSRKKKHMPLE